ncbi:MAG: hypothetical protein ACEPOZ_15440 [Marinifilaceae bacterium]
MEDFSTIKRNLYDYCCDFVDGKIKTSQQILVSLKESASNETKSSAGDKHETGRAMMHLEQEKNAKQLNEALKLRQVLDRIDPAMYTDKIGLGSLVITDKGRFYFAVAAGKLSCEQKDYYAVSLSSPVANVFMGREVKDEVNFNGRSFRIEAIK